MLVNQLVIVTKSEVDQIRGFLATSPNFVPRINPRMDFKLENKVSSLVKSESGWDKDLVL